METKKIKLGKGSKANHLTYLGDAEIGAGVNIGAGTITCNYDGVHKHKTVIEDAVFIGSDSTLVAPVRIGKGAYVGAASCITDDVPEDALAIGRGRQIVKEGWAREKRKKIENPTVKASETKKGRFAKRIGLLHSKRQCFLVRDSRKQVRVHQRLKLLVAGFEVHLQVGAVRVDGSIVDRDFLRRSGAHLLVQDAGLRER